MAWRGSLPRSSPAACIPQTCRAAIDLHRGTPSQVGAPRPSAEDEPKRAPPRLPARSAGHNLYVADVGVRTSRPALGHLSARSARPPCNLWRVPGRLIPRVELLGGFRVSGDASIGVAA